MGVQKEVLVLFIYLLHLSVYIAQTLTAKILHNVGGIRYFTGVNLDIFPFKTETYVGRKTWKNLNLDHFYQNAGGHATPPPSVSLK